MPFFKPTTDSARSKKHIIQDGLLTRLRPKDNTIVSGVTYFGNDYGSPYQEAGGGASESNGIIPLDGIDDLVGIYNSFAWDPSNFSIGGWWRVKQVPSSGSYAIWGTDYTLQSNDPNQEYGWIVRTFLTSSGYIQIDTNADKLNTTGQDYKINSSWYNFSSHINDWVYMTLTFDGDWKLYIDGSNVATMTNDVFDPSVANLNSNLYIGWWAGNNAYADLGHTHLYMGKTLSSTEVTHNFNALRDVYGV